MRKDGWLWPCVNDNWDRNPYIYRPRLIFVVDFDTLTVEFEDFFVGCQICGKILLRATCFLSFVPTESITIYFLILNWRFLKILRKNHYLALRFLTFLCRTCRNCNNSWSRFLILSFIVLSTTSTNLSSKPLTPWLTTALAPLL